MGDDGEVEVAVLDALEEVRGRLAGDGDLGARVRAREAGEDLGQIALGVVVRQAEADAAGEVGLVEGGDAFRVQSHDAPGVVEEALAVFGEARGAPVALEHGPAEALLEALHLHRHGALGLVHDVGRLGEEPVSEIATNVRS